jgi:sugar O-acyltransferase (sialic acid O-acetyltransferase NeuD family)
MSDAFAVLVPLLNTNEPEARVVQLHVRAGERVERGQVLCTLETTKSAVELEAGAEGFVVALAAEVGDRLRAGDRLCWIAADPDWMPPEDGPQAEEAVPAGLRITQPARRLARDLGLDLGTLDQGTLITEADVRRLSSGHQSAAAAAEGEYNPVALVIYGGGGHGKSLIDLVRAAGRFDLVGVIDDGMKPGDNVMGLEVLGGAEMLGDLVARGVRQAVNAVGGVGNVVSRVDVFRRLHEAGFRCPTVVHPISVIEPSAHLSEAVQVMPRAYIGSESHIGYGSIVNTAAVVSHDCQVGSYVNVAPGALIAGAVEIGDRSLVGMGVTINLEVRVGQDALIGNGATVKRDVPDGAVVRAGSIWPPREAA